MRGKGTERGKGTKLGKGEGTKLGEGKRDLRTQNPEKFGNIKFGIFT